MSETIKKKAVIYCRVSDTKQKTRGDGLNSQETRCREYAKFKGYIVETVFKDDMTGGASDRPGMQAALKYLRKHRSDPRVLIIDDISRLARGLDAHLKLRNAIANAGATLESPSIEFGEDSDSILVENLLASVSQHQRQKNSEQTRNRMRARLMNGYWVFQVPVGYKYQSSSRGKILARDEPLASIIQEALEGYASGRFQIQAEVKRFLESFPEYPRDTNGDVRNQRVTNLLTRVIYAGYVDSPEWDVSLRKGKHEGLISFETYQKIQARLKEAARVPARKDINADFPLRGFITCGDCGAPLTACWSKGRGGRYPYYLCHQKGCSSYRKSIRRDVLEGAFETLLRSLKPTEGIFTLATAMFEELWAHRLVFQKKRKGSLEAEIVKTDRKIGQLLDRIVDASSSSVIGAYEKRIQKLEEDKIVMQEKLAACGRPVADFDAGLRTALNFLENPYKLWTSERLEDKRAVLKLTFADRLAYVRNEGFRTAEITLPFRVLGDLSAPKSKMARPERFELPTNWFEASYSIQLSYGRVAVYYLRFHTHFTIPE